MQFCPVIKGGSSETISMHHIIMSSSKVWAWLYLHLSLNHFCSKLDYYMLEDRENGHVNAFNRKNFN